MVEGTEATLIVVEFEGGISVADEERPVGKTPVEIVGNWDNEEGGAAAPGIDEDIIMGTVLEGMMTAVEPGGGDSREEAKGLVAW